MANKLIPIKGSVPVNNHKIVGSVPPEERIEVTLKLRRKSEQELPTVRRTPNSAPASGE